MRVVVDTNVPIVANGRNTNASPSCREKAIDALMQILKKGTVIVDLNGDIYNEYRRHCEPKGEPGIGDRFFRELFMNYSGKVERIDSPKNDGDEYLDFPSDDRLAQFDLADRKFAALSKRSNAPVLNATDTDWLNFLVPLRENGIVVKFVCGDSRADWFT